MICVFTIVCLSDSCTFQNKGYSSQLRTISQLAAAKGLDILPCYGTLQSKPGGALGPPMFQSSSMWGRAYEMFGSISIFLNCSFSPLDYSETLRKSNFILRNASEDNIQISKFWIISFEMFLYMQGP
jgi:hypothetical protein